ncbi:hypothetical protein BOX15_Mlig023403g1 [Macrostomum lignano]|uniref:TRAF-type domain-containing protein n=1 Tax=Macrostomum lignano TaxID=282301 RepID=A0A267GGT5_9PLAT|nr:hypothetical protein BOX15_Mlig023403g1 [Macrostomum lignano]
MDFEPQEVSERAAAADLAEGSRVAEHLKCQKCKGIAVNCYQTWHGCRLCTACATEWKRKRDVANHCPCGEDDQPGDCLSLRLTPYIPDTATRREVNNLTVSCPNKSRGCEHTCARKHVENHLKTECKFEMTKCDLCEQEVPLYRLTSHHKNSRCHLQDGDKKCRTTDARLQMQQAATDRSHASSQTQPDLRNSATLNLTDLADVAGSSEEVGNVPSNDSVPILDALRRYLAGEKCEDILLSIFATSKELISTALPTEAGADGNQSERFRKLASLVGEQNPTSRHESIPEQHGERRTDPADANSITLRLRGSGPRQSSDSSPEVRKSAPPRISRFDIPESFC